MPIDLLIACGGVCVIAMSITPVFPPPFSHTFLTDLHKPRLNGVLMEASDCHGGRHEESMGQLVELGVVFFLVEVFAEGSFAPTDSCEPNFGLRF